MITSRAQLVALVALTLVWGLNWPLMKFSLRELSPLYFRAVTMTGGALMLLGWYRLRGVPMRLPRDTFWPVVGLALPNIFGWHLFSILGVQELASGRAATLGFTMPIWTVLLAALFFGQGLSHRAIVGMASAGAAVALLVAHEVTALAGRPLGVLWMQLAAVSWALGFRKPVLYVAGNHEFYGSSLDGAVAELDRLCAGTQVRFLDNREVILGGVRFLGTTL